MALAAGSIVSRVPDAGSLPAGEQGRRDYRITPPLIDDAAVSGTTAAGVVQAIDRLSGGRLSAIPYSGPWSGQALDGLFELVAALERPVTLIANVATRHLWGAAPSADQLLGYLLDGADDGPPRRLGRGALRVRDRARRRSRAGPSTAWPTPTLRSGAAASTCSRGRRSSRRWRERAWRPAG